MTKSGERNEDAKFHSLGNGKGWTIVDALMSDEITFDDCCRIILEQGPPIREPVVPDKPNYRRDLLALLNKEFGIDWNDTDKTQCSPIAWDADGNPLNRDVPYIATTLVRRYGGITNPFSESLFDHAALYSGR